MGRISYRILVSFSVALSGQGEAALRIGDCKEGKQEAKSRCDPAKLEKLQLQLQLLQLSHLSSPGPARLGRQGGEVEWQRVLDNDNGMGNGSSGSGLWPG